MSTITGTTHAAIFGRLIESDPQSLSPEVAHHLLRMKFPPRDRERINELAAKASQGTLSDAESAELERYNLVGDVLAIWQSRARLAINGH